MKPAVRKRFSAPIPTLDLDAIKREGLNSDAESKRMLEAHEKRQRIDLEIELQRKKREGK